MKKIENSSKQTSEQLRKAQEADELRKQLVFGPDSLIERKGSDKSLDKKIEKIELISGEIIDIKKLYEYIDNKINDYGVQFQQSWYREIFRLNGWEIPESGIISKKPSIVAKYTIDIIYGRFPKEVLPVIESKNKFDEIGIRMYKHFQFLTPEGVKKLSKYLEESELIMTRCTHWDEFVREHAKAYGHPFQMSLFD